MIEIVFFNFFGYNLDKGGLMTKHTIPAFYSPDSEVLILGSFPSVKSRAAGFYYAHPQNRFWLVLAQVFEDEVHDKKEFLKKHHLALFDVCASCEIKGSSDASIKKVIPNDLTDILTKTNIKVIILNGKTAAKLYYKFMGEIPIKTIVLPSTSPANARLRLPELIEAYKVLRNFTK